MGLFPWFFAARRTPLSRSPRRRRSWPILEILEDRLSPATLLVTTMADNTSIPAAFAGTGTLRQAVIDAAATGGSNTIDFDPSLAGETVTLSLTDSNSSFGPTALVVSGDNVTIDGSGAPGLTISGNNTQRIFAVAAGAGLTLENLTLTDGQDTTGDGGAIENLGDLTLTASVISGNTVTSTSRPTYGGGVDNQGTLQIDGCTFANNTAASTYAGNPYGYGGAIANRYTAAHNLSVIITNSTFVNNSATIGGVLDNYGIAQLTGSTCYNNNTTGNGGALENRIGASLSLVNATIADNTSQASGGGIRNLGSLSLVNCTVSGNTASTDGGGISQYPSSGDTTLVNTIVAGNTAPVGPDIQAPAGRPVTANNSLIGDPTDATIVGSGNLNGDPGLDSLQCNGGPTPTIALLPGSQAIDAGDDSVLNAPDNLTTDQRGAPRDIGNHVDIGAYEYVGSIVVTSTADGLGTLTTSGGTVYDTTLRGALASIGPAGTITFQTDLAGAIDLSTGDGGLGTLFVGTDVTIQGPATQAITIEGGTVAESPDNAQLFVILPGVTATLQDLILINGSGESGGAIANAGALTLRNCTLSGNTASYGGAIDNYYGKLPPTEYLPIPLPEIGLLTLTNCTLSGNTASYGGALYNSGTATLTNCTLSGNTACSYGGAIENPGTLTLTNSTLYGNSAYYGGAIENSEGSVTVTNCTIAGNSAESGGGIDNSGTVVLNNTLLGQNTADDFAGNPADSSSSNNLIQLDDGSGLTNGDSGNQIGVAALLGPLQDNGGPTQTMALLPGSPAIDAGSNAAATAAGLTTDQRGPGYYRIVNGTVDIGAYETPMTLAITPSGTLTNASPITFTFTFGGTVTGFNAGDVTITNGTAGTFTVVDGATYTLDVTPLADGTVSVSVAAGAVTDTGGAPTPAASASVTSDRTPPTVAITPNATETNTTPITFTFTFSEPVTGFGVGSFTVTGATKGAFASVSSTVYTETVLPIGDGVVSVGVAAGVVSDAAGNGNVANSASVTVDRTDPFVQSITPNGTWTNASPIPFTFTFSESVTGFTAKSVTITNGTAGTFTTISGSQYTLDVTPSGEGLVSVSVAANAFTDLAGNANTVGASASVTFDDQPTTVTFGALSSPLSQALASETIVFSAPVPGLTLADLSLTQSGSANLLTAAQTLTTTDNLTWTLGNLAGLPSLTHRVAGFTLTLDTAGLTDLAGNAVTAPAPLSFIEVDAPLTLNGTTLTVPGTAGDDTFTFNAGPAEQLSLNGVTYTIDTTLVSTVQFQGNGGNDTATLFAAGSHNTATLLPGAGTLQGSGYTVDVSGVTLLTVKAASASDYASFSADSGGSIYIGAPTFSRWIQGSLITQTQNFPAVAATGVPGDIGYLVQAPGQYLVATHDYSLLRTAANPLPANEIIGFSNVITTAAAGNSDTAYLFSTAANSHFIATPATADLITGGVVNEVRGFQKVVASSSSGSDAATFVDTVGSNAYVGTPSFSFLLNGQSGAEQEAIGFALVYASAPSGGSDVATLLDSTGQGGLNFLATPTYSLLRAGSTILNELVGFPSVTAEVTAGGTDTATLYDAPGIAGLFDGGPTDAELRAGAYYVRTVGFAQVSAYATPGNQDTGYLADGPAGGTFYGQGNAAVLAGLPAFNLALYGFGDVIALGSTGSNHLSVAAIDYVFSDVGTWSPA